MKSDVEIAQEAILKPISEIAEQLNLNEDEWIPYGRNKAKIDLGVLHKHSINPQGKLVLVTAMSPTPAGEGKSTITIGLAQALNKIGHFAISATREPSLGPNFGMKGGAAGGGYAQVLPMTDINLHFTGDFHAITTAHNLLAALIDNHLHQGNALRLDPARITWRRVLDVNDRALRQTVIGLGGKQNGVTRETGFDITVASEIMAILCLVEDSVELKCAIEKILIGYNYDNVPVTVADLGVAGALAALLKDAIHPNLVQTTENTPALVHGGPFGNIAHGCNSLAATRMGMQLAEYVITEAGFGADLGAEKFFNIKCRRGNLNPSAAVIVSTVRALKYHGGVERADLSTENLDAIRSGFANLAHHADIIQQFNVPFVICVNRFPSDTEAELELVQELCRQQGIEVAVAEVFSKGGAGGEALAHAIVRTVEKGEAAFMPLYRTDSPIADKVATICKSIYGAKDVVYSAQAARQLKDFEKFGWGDLPICMAKTPYSFSDQANRRGNVSDFTMTIREIRPSLGAGFLVCITGDIMTMPGLPKNPNALQVDVDCEGHITGLF